MNRFQEVCCILILSTSLSSCSTTKPYRPQVSIQTIGPGEEIKWLGKEVHLRGRAPLAVGKNFPELKMKDHLMRDAILRNRGKVQIISVVPSLDTPVCEIQTHKLAESKHLDSAVERVTVSMDLPYAQARFKDESTLTNLNYMSDFAYKDFGHKLGLLVEEKGLLARAVYVIDKKGVIRYLQIVPDIVQLPDLEKAIETANRLAKPSNQANRLRR